MIIVVIILVVVAFHLGEAAELKKVIANSPGARAAAAAASTAPTDPKLAAPTSGDTNAVATGDVGAGRSTP